jgi:hypothetical protein
LTANTQTTPPCGTLFSSPMFWSSLREQILAGFDVTTFVWDLRV